MSNTIQASDPRLALLQNLNLQEIQDVISHGHNGAGGVPTKDDLKPVILKQLKANNQDLPNADQVADWLANYISKRFDSNSAESQADKNGSPEIPSLSGNPNDKGALGKLGNWLRDIMSDARDYLKDKNVSDDQHDPNDVADDGVANALIGNKDDPDDGVLDKLQKKLNDLFNPDEHSIDDINDLLDQWLKQNPYTGRPSNENQEGQGTGQGQSSGGTTGGDGTTGGGNSYNGGPIAGGGPVGVGTTGNIKTDGSENTAGNSGTLFANWPSDAKIQELLDKYQKEGDTAGDSPQAREAQLNAVCNDLGLSPEEKEFFIGMAKVESGSDLKPDAHGDWDHTNLNGQDYSTHGPLSCAMNFADGNPRYKEILTHPDQNYKSSALLGLMNVRKQMSNPQFGQLSPGRSVFAGILSQHQTGFANKPQSEWQNIAQLYKDRLKDGSIPRTAFWNKLLGELGG